MINNRKIYLPSRGFGIGVFVSIVEDVRVMNGFYPAVLRGEFLEAEFI
jgi:hypothetical protein